ncbi:hypothetical protein JOB18_000334 [Solea senegalensis]|uniref:Uncharacterized protein n=1 Tax=Solea senegalensis TaxID=28829 RepID=A0AAV6R2B9_SOLSE|nr:hypothetical protein JOB18_000334 [Solea senegalensis]
MTLTTLSVNDLEQCCDYCCIHCVKQPAGLLLAVAPCRRTGQQQDEDTSLKGRRCGQFAVMKHHPFKRFPNPSQQSGLRTCPHSVSS